jgi:DNA-binding response OmpR family regulator
MKYALVVDGEPRMCELIEEVLKSEGMDAITLAYGEEAADYAQVRKFDVIFVDSSSPLSDGIALTRKIRGSGFNSKTPIVMITSSIYSGVLTEGFEAGVSILVYKPIDKARLLRLVRVTQGAIENEIRRFRRVPVQVRALVRYGEVEIDAMTIDLSLNGTLVRAQQLFPRGSSVQVRLFLDPAEALVVNGSVARTAKNDEMGIQLEALRSYESARLQEFLLPLVVA